ncbi:DNA repair protein XRCC4 isoform X3 [Pangasianodon hypophthalmus]|uniref:DNA repair protein XRCC4 isoform X3 n=1 Tax=Pangasianodon hypophthalmus TaxID=310915 RepID=UPI000EFFDA7B|nr:DNA repair protein XRCC4 isoform X3 [Pangasianodon hypophthalmus]
MKVTVREISIASKPECTFYLKLEWAKDLGAGFVVLLCDGVSAWSGEVSEEDVSREAQEMEMPRERYVRDLQLILTGEGQADQSYSFHLAPEQSGSPMLKLSYEKVQSEMSFRFGMVELLPVPEPTKVIKELITYGLERSARLQAKKHNVYKENQRLRNEQEHITAEMERYIKEKETLERELYNRFVLILNGKKAKIRTLQERIKQLQNTIQEEMHRWKRGEACHGGNEHADEKLEKSDYGNTTDEEGDVDSKTQNLKQSSNQVLASNPMDESLNDIADVAPSRKRRQRGIQPLESQTKRPALEQRQTLRNDLLEEAKAEVSKVPFQQPTQICPDPDDLFDDI